MTTLRTAAQQALEALEEFCEHQTMLRPIEKRESLKAALAEPQEPVGFKDAPERIWLQACEDDHCEVPFREHDEITWCAEQQNPLDVPYVRADLAAPPQRPAEPVQEALTIERLRDALVASRIVPPAAVEDPDEYDDGVTLHRIEALHRRLA